MSRYVWTALLFLALLATVAIQEAKKSGRVPEELPQRTAGPYERRHKPLVLNAIVSIYTVAVLLAVAATYSISADYGGDAFFRQVTDLGAKLLPVVARMNDELGLPAERLNLLRIETTLFDGAAIMVGFVALVFLMMMPVGERKVLATASVAYGLSKGEFRYALSVFLAIPMAVFCFCNEYLGWSKLSGPDAHSPSFARRCIWNAKCFGHSDDLVVIAGSALGSVFFFVALASTFLMWCAFKGEVRTG